MRRALATTFPAQILSYNKMPGQLQDAGNTTTLATYVRLFRRGSSPKLFLWNNALVNALSLRSRRQAQSDGGWWGRLVENAVGAHLLNGRPDWSWGNIRCLRHDAALPVTPFRYQT